ncbi:hypothetical protein HNP82_002854 [Catenibacillus scindens]|uniref:Uncharacterized protein n=1 Tax=Catenibacillus scindens TaxID=673271 RepID=A0A7W8M5X5_9FIRM|nr:hypothetical protein [Catenibacillus scindens]MBB5265703.1 hypothetical protein [Catenibacillus scindens]
MKDLVLFYDDTKKSCRDYAAEFAKFDHVECEKASEYVNEQLIYKTGGQIGLVFESENGKVPYSVLHIIWRLIADKRESHMIFVTGGSRELKALKSAKHDMEKRGLYVRNVYSKYILQKQKLQGDAAVRHILDELSQGHENLPQKEDIQNMNKKERRRRFRKEFKAYRKYMRQGYCE